MTLSFPFVVLPAHIRWGWSRINKDGSSETQSLIRLSQDLIDSWAGRLGTRNAVGICHDDSTALAGPQYSYGFGSGMHFGGACPMPSSNCKSPLTIILAVLWLKDHFQMVQGLGMMLSMVGVAMIVLPPLDHDHACVKGIGMTVLSATIGGFYLTSWRWLEVKNEGKLKSKGGFCRCAHDIECHWDMQSAGKLALRDSIACFGD